MTRNRGVVGEDRMVAHDAIMSDMGIGHDPVVVADERDARILDRPAIDRRVLANRIAIADLEPGILAVVFLVLRVVANRRERKDVVIATDRRRPLDDHVRLDARSAADLDIRCYDGIGSDADAFVQSRLTRYHRTLVDQGSFLVTIRITASAASWPSTSAWHSKRHSARLRRVSLALSIS